MSPPIRHYEKDDFIIQEGQLSTTIFLLIEGVCLITRQQDGTNQSIKAFSFNRLRNPSTRLRLTPKSE